jgi:hypothetical protein
MKDRRVLAIGSFALALFASCGITKNALRAQTSAGTDEAIPPAEMIGEGVISTDDDELGGGVTPDGKTLIFEKSAAPHYLYILCEAHLVGDQWSKPEILPFSGQYRDTDPVLAPDGKSILFASDRPVNGKDLHRWSIWQAERSANGWKKPQLIPGAVNSEGSQVFASIAANGTIYFASSRKTGLYDVFRSKRVAGEYKEAEDLGPIFNGPGINTFEATIAPDESYILLGSFGRQKGYGSSDIYVSFHNAANWSQPINLGPQINSRARDYSPRISGDGQWLYFTSERGFLETPIDQPYSYQLFNNNLATQGNGLGNLYRIPLAPVLATARKQVVVQSQTGNRDGGQG